MTESEGGFAFPQNDAAVNRINNEGGMTLRDYFAAHALHGMLGNTNLAGLIAAFSKGNERPQMSVSVAAYMMADHMLVARKAGAA